MPSGIFYWILNMSVAGGLTGTVILLFRKIRRIPRRVVYLLWLIPLIRLWIPFGMRSPYSLMSLIDKYAVKTVTVYYDGLNPDFTMLNCIGAAEDYFPVVYKTDVLENVFEAGFLVWLIIAASFILTAVMLYVFTKSEIRGARHIRGRIYRSDRLLSPAVFGIFRPKIVLPEYLKDEAAGYILLHEQVHMKRLDNLWRVTGVITCCIHWFNPFSWIFLKCFLEDMELSCDEAVLRKCGEDEKEAYAGALIDCEAEKAVFVSAFGGAKTRVRIEKILSYRKMTVFSTVCILAFMIAAAVTLLTNTV